VLDIIKKKEAEGYSAEGFKKELKWGLIGKLFRFCILRIVSGIHHEKYASFMDLCLKSWFNNDILSTQLEELGGRIIRFIWILFCQKINLKCLIRDCVEE